MNTKITKTITIALFMVLALSACAVPGQKYKTLEEYYESEDRQQELTDLAAENSSDGVIATVEVNENTILITMEMEGLENTPEMRELFETQYQEQASTICDMAYDIKEEAGLDCVILATKIVNEEGEVLYEGEFSSDDASTEESE